MSGNACDELGASFHTGEPSMSVEDCKCPICMDYFIDVVETRCNHRFCNYCLTNWLRISAHRRCPTCRSTIAGAVDIKPELQILINLAIDSVLSEGAKAEREQVNIERRAQLQLFSDERQHTQSLLASITSGINSSRARARRGSVGSGLLSMSDNDINESLLPTYLTQHIMDWWDENEREQFELEETGMLDPAQRNTGSGPVSDESFPLTWFNRNRSSTNPADSNGNGLAAALTLPIGTPPSGTPLHSNSQNFNQTRHDHLVGEYRYHLERVTAAYSRIREAYRDFNFHNGRMVELLEEERNSSRPNINEENNRISYEDFGDLFQAERRELSHVPTPGPTVLENSSGTAPLSFPSFFNRHLLEERNSTRGISPRTSALDMEQIINHRRSQLLQLSSMVRQWDPQVSGHISSNTMTPPVTVFQARESRSSNGNLQQQLLIDRLSRRNSSSTTTCPRRFRRILRNRLFGGAADLEPSNTAPGLPDPGLVPMPDPPLPDIESDDGPRLFSTGNAQRGLYHRFSSDSDDDESTSRRRVFNFGRSRQFTAPARRQNFRNFGRSGRRRSPFFARGPTTPISIAPPTIIQSNDGPPAQNIVIDFNDAGQDVPTRADSASPGASAPRAEESLSQSVNDLSSMNEYLKTICDRFRQR